MPPHDRAAAEAVLAERKDLLARFRGTPFGEELALNDVETYRPTTWHRTTEVPSLGRSPTESEGPKSPPAPGGGGSSGGGAPTTR